MNIPAASARAIYTMSTSDYLVILPAVTVKLLPLPGFWRYHVFYPTHGSIFKKRYK
jgi:hypothetical protein